MAMKLTGIIPKAPKKFIPKKADTPKQAGRLKGSTPKAPSKYTPKRTGTEIQSRDSYMRGRVRNNQRKQYAWESKIFKRFGFK